MELRTGFQKPFPETNAIFLSDEDLADLRNIVSMSRFSKDGNRRVATELGIILHAPYGSKWRL